MKSFAIQITWFWILIIASIVIAITLLITLKERITDFFYCEFYAKIFLTSLPEKCIKEKKVEKVYIDAKNEQELITQFLSYLIKCWQDVERYKQFKTHYCYEIEFRNVNKDWNISAKQIANELKNYDDCKTLQFKTFNCGYRDDIIWNVGESQFENITMDKRVFIKYNAEEDKIEIIA